MLYLESFKFNRVDNFKASHITSVGETIDVGLSRDGWFESTSSHFKEICYTQKNYDYNERTKSLKYDKTIFNIITQHFS